MLTRTHSFMSSQVAYLLQRLDPAIVAYVGQTRPADATFTSAPVLAARMCLARPSAEERDPLSFYAHADINAVLSSVLCNKAHYGVS